MKTNEIKKLFASAKNEVKEAALYCFNDDAECDDAGDVWLDRGQGVWLDDDQIKELATWIETETGQKLAKWAGQ